LPENGLAPVTDKSRGEYYKPYSGKLTEQLEMAYSSLARN